MSKKSINWKAVKQREAHFLKHGAFPSEFPTTAAKVKQSKKSVVLIYGQGRR